MMEFTNVPGARLVHGREVQGILPVDCVDEGDLRLYKLALPFLPPSKNVYDNWPNEWRTAAKKRWERHITDWAHAHAMPRAVKVGLAAVLVFPTRGRRDLQNYSQTLWHFVPDGLQKAGVLTDDSVGHVEFGPNLGVRFAYDLRTGIDKKYRQRTHLAVTMRVQ